MHHKVLVGEKVYLSPRNSEDYKQYTEWINNLEISTLSGSAHIIKTEMEEKEYLESKTNDYNFGIIEAKTDKLLGSISLANIDHINRTAEFGIFIGDKNYHGNGYGSEAITLLLDYGFNILNLNNIRLTTFSYNKRAIRCYEKVGFKMVGKIREGKIISGKKYDLILMDMLASEFKSSKIYYYLNNDKK